MRVLLLAGTAEARALAMEMAAMSTISPVASLAGVTLSPQHYAVPVRRGGFGGADGLRTWLRRERCGAIVDATHPFAEIMQANAQRVAGALAIPYLRLLRPPWQKRPGWREVPDAQSAAQILPADGRVLLTAGRKDLLVFRARRDVTFFLRTIDPVRSLPENMRPVVARPPFSFENESVFLSTNRISHLVTKNAGGAGTAKLDAADSLGIETIVIARPPRPECDIAVSVEEAVAWLRRQVVFAE